jgi:hypothetical protein
MEATRSTTNTGYGINSKNLLPVYIIGSLTIMLILIALKPITTMLITFSILLAFYLANDSKMPWGESANSEAKTGNGNGG